MENVDQQNVEEQESPLIVTEEMRSYIYETAKWAKFLSVIGFIFTALMIFAAFSVGSILSSSPVFSDGMSALGKIGGTGLAIIYLLVALVYFYPSLLMYKYASNANQGILYGDQAGLNEATRKMKSLFKFWGILTIVIVSFYFIAIIMVVVAGLGAASLVK